MGYFSPHSAKVKARSGVDVKQGENPYWLETRDCIWAFYTLYEQERSDWLHAIGYHLIVYTGGPHINYEKEKNIFLLLFVCFLQAVAILNNLRAVD